MPAGRLQVAYDDIGYDGITQKIDGVTIVYSAAAVNGSASVGLAVTWSADDTVALTQDADAIAGKLLQVFADGFCTVAFKGFASFPAGASATVTRGRKIVGALGAASARGYIRQCVVPGAAYSQAEQAEAGRARGTIWNTADTTNVWVDL